MNENFHHCSSPIKLLRKYSNEQWCYEEIIIICHLSTFSYLNMKIFVTSKYFIYHFISQANGANPSKHMKRFIPEYAH